MNRLKNWVTIAANDKTTIYQWLLFFLVNTFFVRVFKDLGYGGNLVTWTISAVLATAALVAYKVVLHNRKQTFAKE